MTFSQLPSSKFRRDFPYKRAVCLTNVFVLNWFDCHSVNNFPNSANSLVLNSSCNYKRNIYRVRFINSFIYINKIIRNNF
jgi:hypothetical protein